MGDTAHNALAVDLGASNGRVVLGRLDRERLRLQTVHRFGHSPQRDGERIRWDWPRIIESVREGLAAAAELVGDEPIVSVSCDSWAQDFGLLDEQGRLLFPPVSYRDARTEGVPESFADVIERDELVRRVGSVASPITTLCQLRAMALAEPEVLDAAATLLHIADLVHHDMCGSKVTDRTMATASQLRNLRTGEWDLELLEALAISHHFLPEAADSCAVVGHIAEDSAPHPRLRGLPVVSSAGHDTAAAAAILPSAEEGALSLSCGTWSMLGWCSNELLVPGAPARDGLAILGLAQGRWGLFRGIMGLWLIQECRRAWSAEGLDMSFEEIAAAARTCSGTGLSLIDPDDPRFVAPAHMPREICAYCAETGRGAPQGPGELARVVLTSLALDCRMAMETLARATGQEFQVLRMVGGGSANELLCQLTADAIGMPVIAGPVEATAVGNVLLQAQVMGLVDSNEDIPALVARSFPLTRYEPADDFDDELCQRFIELKRRHAG